MYTHITVVPSDRLIIVDGMPLWFDFSAPLNLHALQWHAGSGYLELNDGQTNRELTLADYSTIVEPYVTLWVMEKQRLDEEAEAAKAILRAEYHSAAARAERLRIKRDLRLSATDYMLMPDYPLSDEMRAAIQAYRQALRDLPSQTGFPWDGGEAGTPWPVQPA